MKKEEFVEALSAKGYTKKDASIIYNDFVNVMTETLVKGESIQFHGFGTFEVVERPSKSTIDLVTKKRITIPAYKTPKFVAGISLKKAIKSSNK